jgi:hypothetical protein
MPSLTDSKTRRLLAQPARPLSALHPNKQQSDEGTEFLRLSKPRKQVAEAYRTITREEDMSSDESNSSSPSDPESSDGEGDRLVLSSHQATLKSLEEILREDPSSISTWLSLLSHSTAVISLDSKNAARTRAEIAVSILSRAIWAHPSNKTSVRLRLKHLKAGEEEWDAQRLNKEWESALKLNSIEIWMGWLNWRISDARGGIHGFVEDAKRALRTLHPQDETGRLRVQWRVAVALRQAGKCHPNALGCRLTFA